MIDEGDIISQTVIAELLFHSNSSIQGIPLGLDQPLIKGPQTKLIHRLYHFHPHSEGCNDTIEHADTWDDNAVLKEN